MGNITWPELHEAIQAVALSRGHLAGYPAPVEGHTLQLCPGFPYPGVANLFAEDSDAEGSGLDEGEAIRSSWYSRRLSGQVWIIERGGRAAEVVVERKKGHIRRVEILLETCHVAAGAWEAETEEAAMEKLRSHVDAHQWKLYLTTGTFAETSPRSGVTYIFRRLRPTLALRPYKGVMRILAALCLHPIGYYTGTWAGSMTPTDDVIAHLLLMRADEPLFWRRSNQHAPWRPEAGL